MPGSADAPPTFEYLATSLASFGFDRAWIQAELVEDRRDDAALLSKQRQQQMLGGQFRVPGSTREVLRLGNGLLGLDRKLVEIHDLASH